MTFWIGVFFCVWAAVALMIWLVLWAMLCVAAISERKKFNAGWTGNGSSGSLISCKNAGSNPVPATNRRSGTEGDGQKQQSAKLRKLVVNPAWAASVERPETLRPNFGRLTSKRDYYGTIN